MGFEREELTAAILGQVGHLTLNYRVIVDRLQDLIAEIADDNNRVLQERIALLETVIFPDLDPDGLCLHGCAVDIVDQLLDHHVDFLLEHNNAEVTDFKARLDVVRAEYPHLEMED